MKCCENKNILKEKEMYCMYKLCCDSWTYMDRI